jgi:hypothetical protein
MQPNCIYETSLIQIEISTLDSKQNNHQTHVSLI